MEQELYYEAERRIAIITFIDNSGLILTLDIDEAIRLDDWHNSEEESFNVVDMNGDGFFLLRDMLENIEIEEEDEEIK